MPSSISALDRDAARRTEAIAEAFPDGIRSRRFDRLLSVRLYDYQKEGALFAARAGRSLIGDEMGLGKTIQAIAAAEIMAGSLDIERVLVVCPTSLKHQWQREIESFSKRRARVIEGLRPARAAAYATDEFFKITNCDTVHTDLDLIARWSPDLVSLDEAQREAYREKGRFGPRFSSGSARKRSQSSETTSFSSSRLSFLVSSQVNVTRLLTTDDSSMGRVRRAEFSSATTG